MATPTRRSSSVFRPLQRRALLRDGLLLLLLLVSAWLLAAWSYRASHTAAFGLDTPPAMLPRTGMYDLESFADRPGSYRWTNGAAQLKLPNPGGPASMQLLLAGGPGRSMEARVAANALAITITVRPEPRHYFLALPASAGERIAITINSPTVRDARRDLGVVVSAAVIAGGGMVPARVLLALLGASLGVYALVRAAKLPPFAAAGVVLLLQALVMLWQHAGGWTYAIAGALLLLAGGAGVAAAILNQWRGRVSAAERAVLGRRDWMFALGLVALALCVRLPWLAAPDPVGDLELSARRMGFLRAEGLAGAYHADGDYMPLRLYWLRGFSVLPMLSDASFQAPLPAATMVLIKLPGLLADLATVALLYVWSRRWRAPAAAALLAACYALAPPVWMNVAWWGQVDAILVFPLLLMLVLLDRADGRWSWLCWAIALLIKPQAIVFAPVLYLVTVRRAGARGVAIGGALAAGLIALVCAPLALANQGPGLLQAYAGSVGRFPQLTNRAYNLWYLLTGGAGGADTGQGIGPLSFRLIGVGLMGIAALLVLLALWRRPDRAVRAAGAAVLALAFFTLPTQIHERYLFLSLALLVMAAAADQRLLWAYGALVVVTTVNILGTLRGFSAPAYDAIVASPLPLLVSALNIVVLLALLAYLLTRRPTTDHRPPTTEDA